MTTAAFATAAQPRVFVDTADARELLRFSTAGSVDDGKSTLIGRLLYDTRAVYEDQIASVKKSGINRSTAPLDLSLLTDGLRAEREQGITIDVAYRYFSSARRKFIIADTPGHEQYTRNMATGASTADVAVILIDASKGVLPQSRRHSYIAALLGIPRLVAVVNKMDLVDYSREVFEKIDREYRAFAAQLGECPIYSIPVSALEGDNVVRASSHMPWYGGQTLLEHLETVPLRRHQARGRMRFPVQYVIRPDARFRGFAGQVASGLLRPGQPVVALPSGQATQVKSIVTFGGEAERASAGESVTVCLEDEIDVSRGDMLVASDSQPHVARHFTAMLVWMHADALQPGRLYLAKHTTRSVRARVRAIRHRVDVNTLQNVPAAMLALNEIAAVEIETTSPLFFDPYHENRATGSFILIDPISNATVAAGMITGPIEGGGRRAPQGGGPVSLLPGRVSPAERCARSGHHPVTVWIAGRPALAVALERLLFESQFQAHLVADGDFPPEALPWVLQALRDSGAIVIYAAASGAAPQQESVRLTSARFLDAGSLALPADEQQAARRLAAALRELHLQPDTPEVQP